MNNNQNRQEIYINQFREFFDNKSNYERIAKFDDYFKNKENKIYEIVFFFVKNFEPDNLVKTKYGFFKLHFAYKNAISNHKKRFYDVLSKEGKGELIFNGKTNPNFFINEIFGNVKMTLPRIVSFIWFIRYDFDLIFWNRFEEISEAFRVFNLKTKRKYTDSHKKKRKEIKKFFSEQIIKSRKTDEKNKKLNRIEKQSLIKLIKEEKEIVNQISKNLKIKKKPKPFSKPKILEKIQL